MPPTSLPLWLKKLNTAAPRSKAILLRRSGHSPQIEAPGALAAVLGQILAATRQGKEPRNLDSRLTQRWWRVVEDE